MTTANEAAARAALAAWTNTASDSWTTSNVELMIRALDAAIPHLTDAGPADELPTVAAQKPNQPSVGPSPITVADGPAHEHAAGFDRVNARLTTLTEVVSGRIEALADVAGNRLDGLVDVILRMEQRLGEQLAARDQGDTASSTRLGPSTATLATRIDRLIDAVIEMEQRLLAPTVSGFSPSGRVELQRLLEVVMDHASERTAHLERLLHDQWVHRFDTGQPLADLTTETALGRADPTDAELWRDALTMAASQRDRRNLDRAAVLEQAEWFYNELMLGPRPCRVGLDQALEDGCTRLDPSECPEHGPALSSIDASTVQTVDSLPPAERARSARYSTHDFDD